MKKSIGNLTLFSKKNTTFAAEKEKYCKKHNKE